jgi:TonB family protein
VLLLYLAWTALRVRAEGRRWGRREVEGIEVLVSASTGPAALGLFRGRVVLPEWALALDARLRRLLVLHEAEHVRARDPQLAVAGLVTCALMPWNLPLWWQLARLRLAIEVDCDARVLRRSGDAAGYGSLLLEVGQRRRARLAVGLAESRSMLERRIRMITKTGTGRRTLQAAGLAAVAGVVAAIACETPPPTGLADQASQPLEVEQGLAEARALADGPSRIIIDAREIPPGSPEAVREAVAGLSPDGIERVEVVKGVGEGDAAVILIWTKAATPEVEEQMRRIREEILATRAQGAREADAARDVSAAPTFTPMTVRPQLQNPGEARQALQDHYPPLLRDAGIGGVVNVWFLIDEEGKVQRTQINRSSGYPALDQAALRVAAGMQFTPAYNRDVRVPVWVALDIAFETGDPETAAALHEQAREAREAFAARQSEYTARQSEVIQEMVDQARMARQTEVAQLLEQARQDREAGVRPEGQDIAAAPTFTPMTERPQLTNRTEVLQALQRHYPPLLRNAGIGGTANVWFFIDATGAVRDVRINRTSGYEALDQAALRVGRTMEFTPARNRGEAVPVWLALDVTFEVQ